MSAGFYKINLVDAGLMYAPNFVYGPNFTLKKDDEDKDEKEMVSGWKWFNSDSEAYAYFKITPDSQPWTVTPLQAKIALNNVELLDDVEAYMLTADKNTKLAWENASIFKRNSPLLLMLASKLEMTDTQLDDLFAAAIEIEV